MEEVYFGVVIALPSSGSGHWMAACMDSACSGVGCCIELVVG